MREEYNILIEKDEEGWLIGSVIELPGCHTQAKTYDELIERLKEAIALYLEVKGGEYEKTTEFIGIQKLHYQNV